jgi:3',5'-cyclic AMP phosphodiesterase CpdA
MLRIAHLSDLHLNGSYDRRARLLRGLAHAAQRGAHHLVLTGDLTSKGRAEQFAELAQCLSAWPSGQVTIVPGNHDAGTAYNLALMGGALSRFAATSGIDTVSLASRVVDLPHVRILPLDTRFTRRALLFRAIGNVGARQLGGIAQAIVDRSKPLLLVMHHGPIWSPLHFFDGLSDRAQVSRLLEMRPDVHVLSGHDHRVLDIGRVHVAASVAHHPDPLRMYSILNGRLEVDYRSGEEGDYLSFGRRIDAGR